GAGKLWVYSGGTTTNASGPAGRVGMAATSGGGFSARTSGNPASPRSMTSTVISSRRPAWPADPLAPVGGKRPCLVLPMITARRRRLLSDIDSPYSPRSIACCLARLCARRYRLYPLDLIPGKLRTWRHLGPEPTLP